MAEDNAVVSAKGKKHSVKDLGAAGTEFLRNHKHIYTRHRKKILVFFLCIVAVILWVLVFNLRKYDDFDVKRHMSVWILRRHTMWIFRTTF